MILRKIKRLLGLGTDEDGRRSERDVTVQESTETESDGEAVDEPIATETDADASTESLVDEEFANEEPAGRAEPAEAAGPGSDDESTDVETEDAAADDSESEAAPDESRDSAPVDEITGIGPAYSERLAEIGIETVADLLDADAEEIAERTTVPEKTVRKWIDRANDQE